VQGLVDERGLRVGDQIGVGDAVMFFRAISRQAETA
jgi:hypothetical protein